MPWKESHRVMERANFITRLKAGEKMVDLCAEFGISRKTGYKFLERYEKQGELGLLDQSRRPERLARQTPASIERLIVEARRERPTWGAAKLRAYLLRRHPGLRLPVRSTIHEILERNGLVRERPKRLRGRACPTALRQATEPNELWCADFKGQFRLGNNAYCYPLTITDQVSRFVIACEALENTRSDVAQLGFERAFREFGLPKAIRTDNGSPFSSRALLGLSRLSIWWRKLGIEHERIEPGQPQQNGRHERMHLTLKQETTRPAAANFLQQQERFDNFIAVYNTERPHEALEMKTPSAVYQPSARNYPSELPDPDYPLHDVTCTVSKNGKVYVPGRGEFNLAAILIGEIVGLREVDDQLWQVDFMDLTLGHYDQQEGIFHTASNELR